MYRKIIIILIIISILSLSGCGHQTIAEKGNWKIGIMTSTAIVNEEEYVAAESVVNKFGEEHVIHITFPVKFMLEQETMIDKLTLMASDTDVKGIIISQGIPGISVAIDKIKGIRDDILIIVCSPGEDPDIIASKADIVFSEDVLDKSSDILDLATKHGAKTFVHYSFPRHMSYKLLASRRDLLKEECEKQGIEFIEVTTPDPASEDSVSGTQAFIVEDVSQKVEKYGKNTIFFTTNQCIKTLLIPAVVDNEALYPEYCCPSPVDGFRESLGIKVPEDKKGDIDYLVDQVKKKMSEEGMKGRTSPWPVPFEMMFIEGGAEYIKDYIDGNTKGKVDISKIREKFFEYSRIEVEVEQLEYEGKKYDNYLIIELISDFVILGSYI